MNVRITFSDNNQISYKWQAFHYGDKWRTAIVRIFTFYLLSVTETANGILLTHTVILNYMLI